MADPGTADGISDILKSNSVGSLRGQDGSNYVAVIYEAGCAGEAMARAHHRICTFRDEHLLRTIKGSMMAVSADVTELDIPLGHIYLMFDGKVHGNSAALMKGFTDSRGKA